MTPLLRLPRFVLPRLVLVAAALLAVIVFARPAAGGPGTAGAAGSAPEVAAASTAPVTAASGAPPARSPAAIRPAQAVAWGPAPEVAFGAAPAPAISGDAAILLDEASGVTLFQKDAHARLPPASLTKIMTALVALEQGHLDAEVTVNIDSRRMRGSTVMGLVPGDRLTLEDLLYGLMLPSGNDAALALAEHVSGSTEAFVAAMNQRAADLGLVDTHFANPHGLDAAAHYTSAFDLAVLARVAMQRPDFRKIANTKYRVVMGAVATYTLGTLNPLYDRLSGVDGVKTGYTRTARQTLVGSVTRDGHRVLVVVLRSSDRASDGAALLNWAFAAHAWTPPTTVASEGAGTPGT
ncbi:MAG: D-alanyl-D-alanine carboxypeptidase [Dehalococcoidia bacterium]|nr:D-alanyl-D-alanine carboxypeptidase [Dehalococcoidia bacterium]